MGRTQSRRKRTQGAQEGFARGLDAMMAAKDYRVIGTKTDAVVRDAAGNVAASMAHRASHKLEPSCVGALRPCCPSWPSLVRVSVKTRRSRVKII